VGSSPETTYDGFVQRAPARDGTSNGENLYLTSSTGTVIQLLPGGTAWQIITPG
ncbi:MAG: hypothetical protein H7X77_04410, partial [Anaerolineae bacterium]|nr:hypothetical protein [Anaerolineae bacterium]